MMNREIGDRKNVMRKTPLHRLVYSALRVSLLLVLPALMAWMTGQPFIFPSLGPSALDLAVHRGRADQAWHVIGGHLVGVVCGLLAYHLIASGVTLTHLPPAYSLGAFLLALSGVVSLGLTSLVMFLTRTTHGPACATTLIASLGLLPSWSDGAMIMLAVVVMFGVHKLLPRLHIDVV